MRWQDIKKGKREEPAKPMPVQVQVENPFTPIVDKAKQVLADPWVNFYAQTKGWEFLFKNLFK